MPIPVRVRAEALLSGRRPDEGLGAEVEQVLAAVAERALRRGARAGLEALLQEALRLTGVAGIALYEGRARVAAAGMKPPPLARARAPQVISARDGRTALVVLPERISAAERQTLERLARLGGTLLAARRREAAAQARQASLCRELRSQERALAHKERSRSRASHDLRTPLLVMNGYLEMMRKGMAGELTPPMARYLERIMKSAQDMGSLIAQRLAPGNAPQDLLSLLREAFTGLSHSRRPSLHWEGSLSSIPVTGARPELELLTRTLARGLAATGAPQVVLHAEAQEGVWRLCLDARAEHPLPARMANRLATLVHRLGGAWEVRGSPRLELLLHLPAASIGAAVQGLLAPGASHLRNTPGDTAR
jgi:two-component system OmpR family sensor kinase